MTLARNAPVLALSLLLALAGLLLGTLAPPALGAGPSVSGSIAGPSNLGESLQANYTVHGSGGPAEAANGTIIGTYAYNASITAVNRTGASISPSTGVLTNGSVTLSLKAPSVVETLTIAVIVTSSYQGTNRSDNLSYTVHIVQPFVLSATLVAATGVTVGPLLLTVTLDGSPVGTIHVPVITAGSTYPLTFSYVDLNLTPGWHTFAISLASEHGLVTFSGGAQQYSDTFYVNGPPPDYTIWYAAGALAFVGALFIWSTRVAARRRGRAKK